MSNADLSLKRDHVIMETEFGTYGRSLGWLGRAVRTTRNKYMVHDRGRNPEFLVDMVNAPGEMINLAGVPVFQAELERHRILLRDYITRTNDIFPVGRVSILTRQAVL